MPPDPQHEHPRNFRVSQRVVDYQVIRDTKVTEFNERCHRAVKDGWQPYGKLMVLTGVAEKSTDITYIQGFVKYE